MALRGSWRLGAARGSASMAALLTTLACSDPAATRAERCLQPRPEDGLAIAQVGLFPITTRQVAASIMAQGPSAARRYSDPDVLRTYVEDQARLELLAQAALERGLDKDPEVIDAARKIMVRKLLERDLGSAGLDQAGVVVSEEKLDAYYMRNRDKYRYPAMRRIQHIQLAPDATGQGFAAALISQLAGNDEPQALFRELAVRHSAARDGRERGGEIAFISHADLAEDFGLAFANQVFALPSGTVAQAPVQSTRGWHVVWVVAAREELARPLAEVREEIRERLLKDQRAAAFDIYLAELRARYPVAIYDERMQDIARELAAMQKAIGDELQIRERPRDPVMNAPSNAPRDETMADELKGHP